MVLTVHDLVEIEQTISRAARRFKIGPLDKCLPEIILSLMLPSKLVCCQRILRNKRILINPFEQVSSQPIPWQFCWNTINHDPNSHGLEVDCFAHDLVSSMSHDNDYADP
jgi:hypothetical protein